MKIFVTCFCLLIFGLLVLFATVDLEPFLAPTDSKVSQSAADSSKEETAQTDVDDPPPSEQVDTEVEQFPPERANMNTGESGLSRITTHQLIVTEKRKNEKFGRKKDLEQATLPLSGGNVSAPDPEQQGE